jgi:hypothetical protein
MLDFKWRPLGRALAKPWRAAYAAFGPLAVLTRSISFYPVGAEKALARDVPVSGRLDAG